MNLYSIFPIILLGLYLVKCQDCSKPKVKCIRGHTFTLTANIFNYDVDLNVELQCPQGYYCHENADMPCQIDPPKTTADVGSETTQRPTSSTTVSKPGPPQCKGKGYHKAEDCNEYYECVRVLWGYSYLKKKCPSGYYYSSSKPPCALPPFVDCQ